MSSAEPDCSRARVLTRYFVVTSNLIRTRAHRVLLCQQVIGGHRPRTNGDIVPIEAGAITTITKCSNAEITLVTGLMRNGDWKYLLMGETGSDPM